MMFSHRSLTKGAKKVTSQTPELKKADLEAKLKAYNGYYEGKKQEIKRKEGVRLGKLMIVLRSPLSRRRSLTGYAPSGNEAVEMRESSTRANIRRNGKRRQKHRRLSIINGHIFDVETSIFTPAYGSITSVNVMSLDPVPVVIKQLLRKFKAGIKIYAIQLVKFQFYPGIITVINNPHDFCLCIVRSSGAVFFISETRVLKDDDFPLVERVILGPLEDVAKLFIMDKDKVKEVNEEVLAAEEETSREVVRISLNKFVIYDHTNS
ncbi:hypothetical protein LSH36_127g17013 [Paralvinella palmiformis]|uniref:Ras-associating domain-containing protein n=1 Tax=Paralvinella palmiformis TaxID=53620 RepID=A0AAD9JWZ9_9ANNE|nr:hypothetical protein LSH36_127g17013 [Paralvinella palmiformis]